MNLFKAIVGAAWLALAFGLATAHAAPDVQPVRVDAMETCHKGVIVWQQLGANAPKCSFEGMPQVKIFDDAGKLRFIGSAEDAIRWAKAGQPVTPIPKDIRVRDVASEARIAHVAAPPAGHAWVTYYGWTDCPPCQAQLVTFRAEVMPKLAAGTSLVVLDTQ